MASCLRVMAAFGCWWAPAGSSLLATFAVGCCVSMQRRDEIHAALVAENRARAEPAMRSAAEQRATTLLPDLAQEAGLMPLCRPDSEGWCALEPVHYGRAYRLRDDRGSVRLAVPIEGVGAGPTARLARRDTKLLVLVPQVTPGKVSSRTACDCDGMPRPMSADGFVYLGFSFLVDDIPGVDVEYMHVPVTEDQIEWTCNSYAV